MVKCISLEEVRKPMLLQLFEFCKNNQINIELDMMNNEDYLTQLILDPTSLNLKRRVNINHPKLGELFQICRNISFGLHSFRMKKINKSS